MELVEGRFEKTSGELRIGKTALTQQPRDDRRNIEFRCQSLCRLAITRHGLPTRGHSHYRTAICRTTLATAEDAEDAETYLQ